MRNVPLESFCCAQAPLGQQLFPAFREVFVIRLPQCYVVLGTPVPDPLQPPLVGKFAASFSQRRLEFHIHKSISNSEIQTALPNSRGIVLFCKLLLDSFNQVSTAVFSLLYVLRTLGFCTAQYKNAARKLTCRRTPSFFSSLGTSSSSSWWCL